MCELLGAVPYPLQAGPVTFCHANPGIYRSLGGYIHAATIEPKFYPATQSQGEWFTIIRLRNRIKVYRTQPQFPDRMIERLLLMMTMITGSEPRSERIDKTPLQQFLNDQTLCSPALALEPDYRKA